MSGPTQKKEERRRKILVVEDDPSLLRMLKKLLEQVGDVTTAEDGKVALETVRAGFDPDLVVTDIMMPRMDGITFVRRLKANKRTARTPVVMLTAKDGPLDVVQGINAGARAYLTKPFRADELMSRVYKLLGMTPPK